MLKVYGITTCTTVKKAVKWLKDHNVAFDFVDVRADGVHKKQLTAWAQEFGWSKLINKRSKAWRELSAEDKQDLDEAKSIKLILANPTLMKRPVVESANVRLLAFDEQEYQRLL